MSIDFFNLFYFIFIVILVLLVTLILVFLMYVGSDFITCMGTYHQRLYNSSLFSIHQDENKETFLFKTVVSYFNAMKLSLPYMAAFYIYIPNVVIDIDQNLKFCLTLVLTLSILMCIRLTSNPTKTILLKKIQERFVMKGHSWKKPENVKSFFKDDEVVDIAKTHKERVLSFSYAFLLGALLLIYVHILYAIININSSWDLINITLTLGSGQIVFYFIIYIISLFVYILIAEIILWKLNPIIEDK